MSKRVKSHPRASQVEMGARALEEYREIQRRREAQALREQLEQAARQQGWMIKQLRPDQESEIGIRSRPPFFPSLTKSATQRGPREKAPQNAENRP